MDSTKVRDIFLEPNFNRSYYSCGSCYQRWFDGRPEAHKMKKCLGISKPDEYLIYHVGLDEAREVLGLKLDCSIDTVKFVWEKCEGYKLIHQRAAKGNQ